MPKTHKSASKRNSHRDQDCSKGAVESDRDHRGNTSLQGQLGHRDEDPLLKSADSDFPEPGGNPEHSGEPITPKGSAPED